MTQKNIAEKSIGDDTYRVLMLDPMTSGDLLVDLVSLLGPSLSIVGSGILKAKNSKEVIKQLMDGLAKPDDGDSKAAIGDLIGDNLERAIAGLIDRMEKPKLREIINLMKGVTSVKKGDKWPELESIFDAHFRGRVFEMYKWVAMAVRVQYGNF